MLTAAFWRGAAERAVKTFAQSLLAALAVGGIGFGDVDWGRILSVAGVAALVSLLTSLTNPGFVAGEAPAATDPAVLQTPDDPAELDGRATYDDAAASDVETPPADDSTDDGAQG